MNPPLISVILPIYNVENYLQKCMESLFAQTYKNLEFIMVDDGSADKCAKLVENYLTRDSRVVVYHKENGGLSDARNYGIVRAKGEFITCVDPDDYVDCDYVEYLYKILKKYQTRMSIAQHRVRYDNGEVRDNGVLGDEKIETEKCLERMLYHDVIDTSAWGKLYHRSLFESIRYPKGMLFEDIGTTYALMMQCDKIAVGYQSKYTYVFHNNSIVNGSFSIKKLDLLEMTDKMAKEVTERFPRLENAVLRRQVYARFSTLNQMINTNDYKKQKKEIIAYIKKYRWRVIKDPFAPKRDKLAIVLLSFNYELYRRVWIKYKQNLMTKGSRSL